MADKVGKNMTFQMVDANQRHPQGKSKCLGSGYAHQKRPHQPGTIGHCHLVYSLKAQSRLLQCLLYDRHNVHNVLPGGDFRHHAAKFLMDGNLGGNHQRQDLPPAAQNSCRCFITAGFYC